MRHKISEAVSAELARFEGGLARVTYFFDDGQCETRDAGDADWPVIHRLEAAGQLFYADADGARSDP
jgi:hypothetical protein